MSIPRVLTINACDTVQGDVNMLLLALANVEADALQFYAASVPRGDVFSRLSSQPHVHVIPLEMGEAEARSPRRSGKPARILEMGLAVPRLLQVIRHYKIDVIYTIDRTVAPRLASIVTRLTGCPFVLNAQYPLYPTIRRINSVVVKQATRILVPSDFLLAHYPPSIVDPRRVIKVPNAIQIERYDPNLSDEGVRQQLGVEADAPIVVMAGRLSPFKGQDDLVKAAHIILQQRPNVYFFIAGGDTNEGIYTLGPQATSFKAVLQGLIGQYGLEHRVKLVGHYPDLPALMGAATIATMPSWEEPFGLVALEAMAMAKPVIATRAGGVPEFVMDGKTGLLIPPRDPQALARAVLELLDDPARGRAMGRQGRQRVEELYTAQRYAESISRVLHDAMAAGRQAGAKSRA